MPATVAVIDSDPVKGRGYHESALGPRVGGAVVVLSWFLVFRRDTLPMGAERCFPHERR